MPVHRIELGVEGIDPVAVAVFWSANKVAVIQWSQLSGSVDRPGDEEFIRLALQNLFDNRIKLSTLSVGDVDRQGDPDNYPWRYYGNVDGTQKTQGKYLIDRSILVVAVSWSVEVSKYMVELGANSRR